MDWIGIGIEISRTFRFVSSRLVSSHPNPSRLVSRFLLNFLYFFLRIFLFFLRFPSFFFCSFYFFFLEKWGSGWEKGLTLNNRWSDLLFETLIEIRMTDIKDNKNNNTYWVMLMCGQISPNQPGPFLSRLPSWSWNDQVPSVGTGVPDDSSQFFVVLQILYQCHSVFSKRMRLYAPSKIKEYLPWR